LTMPCLVLAMSPACAAPFPLLSPQFLPYSPLPPPPPPTESYTPSLHDALPIFITPTSAAIGICSMNGPPIRTISKMVNAAIMPEDRKSTRLNSSHVSSSYAVFCLKKNNSHPTEHELDLPQRLLASASPSLQHHE